MLTVVPRKRSRWSYRLLVHRPSLSLSLHAETPSVVALLFAQAARVHNLFQFHRSASHFHVQISALLSRKKNTPDACTAMARIDVDQNYIQQFSTILSYLGFILQILTTQRQSDLSAILYNIENFPSTASHIQAYQAPATGPKHGPISGAME